MSDKFRLSSDDRDFNLRVAGLFSSLDEVATELPDTGLVFEPSISGVKRSHDDDSAAATPAAARGRLRCYDDDSAAATPAAARGRLGDDDGNFRIPTHRNIPSNKRFKKSGRSSTPGFMADPEKWVCYDMKDTEVLNDSENKRAALQLLSDLKVRSDVEMSENDTTNESSIKLVFKKRTNVPQGHMPCMSVDDEEQSAGNISADFGGTNKFVMDEYVVGSKKKKKNKDKTAKTNSSKKDTKEIKLSYLTFDDECD